MSKRVSLVQRILEYSEIEPTRAQYISSHTYIPDFHYVSSDAQEETCDLIREATARLVWGRSCTSTPLEKPFAESLWLYESACNRAVSVAKKRDPYCLLKHQERISDPQHQAWTRAKVREMQRAKEREEKRSHDTTSGQLPTMSRRKRMKNRTREERIKDLRKALGEA